ncbi:MAG: OsmC family protein [Marivivens sp.]|jgi:putative redox protein|nr:OsmC family protein [Marivivens sp.]
MKARVKWAEQRTFIGTSGTGHSIVLGTRPSPDAPTPGPSPMELVLLGAAGCSSYDVVSILEKGRERIEDCVCDVDADRATEDPKVFTKIHMQFTISGRNLNEKKVARAVDLSVEKYCSAIAMLAKTADVSHAFTIIDTSD